ncbi:MAG: phosphate/phosphite/phosphonate ABC transporter substrate-binding protein [Burkholderiaceae bacterium]
MRRRHLLQTAAALGAATLVPALHAQPRKLRCAVAPFLPTPEDTRKAFTPFFEHMARSIGAPGFELAVTSDWAGLAVAMGSGHLDLAWMGPWGYMLANQASGCRAIATVKYDDKPTYQAIVIARPDLKIARFPDDTRGMGISFADVGSTSGWLIPHYYAKTAWQIDPRAYWRYNEGASHAANEIAVQAGQIDLATDYDRNRNAMIDAGRIRPDGTRVVWSSDPLPNDPLAVSRDLPVAQAQAIQRAALAITPAQALELMPKRYTGWVTASHASYQLIETAGQALGRLKRR